MIAQLLGIILTIIPIPGGNPAARLEIKMEHCEQIRKLLPQARCVTDGGMLTVHVSSRSDFKDPIARKAIAFDMESWFRVGGRLFTLHMRKQDDFMICVTRRSGFQCWTAQRVTGEGVDSEDEVLQDATPLEDSP